MIDQCFVLMRRDQELPIREGPLRFALLMSDGSTSNSWRVWVEKEGDAYICCRDNMKEVKVSLHRSGQQRIAYRTESGIVTNVGNRVWMKWEEPPHCGPVLPSFKLVLPPWGVRLNANERSRSRESILKRNSDQVLIEGDDELTVFVDFILRDEEFLLNESRHTTGTLAVIPAPTDERPRRQLFVVIRKAHNAHFLDIAGQALEEISSARVERLALLKQDGNTPVACFCGFGDQEHSHAYIVVAPVTVQTAEPDSFN